MKVKTFQGGSMAEALADLKREFGRGAVILTTRTFTRGGFLGLGGKPCVEITAAREMTDVPAPLRRGSIRMRSGGVADPSATICPSDSIPSVRSTRHRAEPAIPRVAAAMPNARLGPQHTAGESGLILPGELVAEVGSVKSMVADLVRETRKLHLPMLAGDLYDAYQGLVSNAVADEIALRLVDQVKVSLTPQELADARAVRAALAEAIRPTIPAAGPIAIPPKTKPFIVALIGPTGVGKTTTVAKLAANFCLRERRKVGLITLDTYRIAAVEQLKTYAQIIDVPLEVAMSAEQLKEAVERLSDCQVILIDTAGRSQRDAGKIHQLQAFFSGVRPHEVHLVLSSTAGQRVLDETIERFEHIGIDRVIFTKLDEALGFGVIVNCLQKARAKLSYVTTGQDVPSDIEIGESKALAELILGPVAL